MFDWATFHGAVNDDGDAYKLSGTGDEGVFRLPKEAVLFENGKISVKVEATASAIQEPMRPADVVGFESKEWCVRACSMYSAHCSSQQVCFGRVASRAGRPVLYHCVAASNSGKTSDAVRR